MTSILFIEVVEVTITDEFNTFESQYIVPHTFYPGEEIEVDSISEAAAKDEETQLVLIDGSVCFVPTDCFILTETGDSF